MSLLIIPVQYLNTAVKHNETTVRASDTKWSFSVWMLCISWLTLNAHLNNYRKGLFLRDEVTGCTSHVTQLDKYTPQMYCLQVSCVGVLFLITNISTAQYNEPPATSFLKYSCLQIGSYSVHAASVRTSLYSARMLHIVFTSDLAKMFLLFYCINL